MTQPATVEVTLDWLREEAIRYTDHGANAEILANRSFAELERRGLLNMVDLFQNPILTERGEIPAFLREAIRTDGPVY